MDSPTNIFNPAAFTKDYSKGGYFELSQMNRAIEINGEKWLYLASGLCRAVFASPCGRYVAKVPKNTREQYDEIWLNISLSQNLHDVGAYDEAPEIFKPHIAQAYLLPNGLVIQERVQVEKIRVGLFREIGVRADGTYCIFDCDPLLDGSFNRPKKGYAYAHAARMLSQVMPSEVVEWANEQRGNDIF